jgi:hypothetical protein
MPPTIEQLAQRHPTHKRYAEHWHLLSALANGGSAVDGAVKQRLLINPDGADADVIGERAKLASYDPLIGSILMKLVSQLMKNHASYEGDNDEWWENSFLKLGALLTDDEGLSRRDSFHALLSKAVFRSLVQGAMVGVVDTAGSSDEPYSYLLNRWDLWDWQGNSEGLTYAKIHGYNEYRKAWDQPITCQHTFTIYQHTESGITASIYLVEYDEKYKRATTYGFNDLEHISERDATVSIKQVNGQSIEDVPIFSLTDGTARFPVVVRVLEKPLQIADQLFDSIKSLFNSVAASEWALLQTNYAMLKFTGVDQPHQEGNNNPANMVKHGNGYYLELSDGQDAAWLVRPGGDIKLSLDYQQTLKTKMLELINKIAESAANAYAMRVQSGESKKEQRRDLDILLEIYGESIRGFATGLLDVASIARGTNATWTVKGFSDYNSATFSESLEQYLELDKASIDSPTLKRESRKAIAAKAIQSLDLPDSLMSQVADELDEDSPFSLSPEGMDAWIELFKAGGVSAEDIYRIFELAGLKPKELSIAEMLENIGMGEGLPQTNNPVLNGQIDDESDDSDDDDDDDTDDEQGS